MADYVRDAPDQINFAKRAKAAELMQQIELHQSTTYSLKAVPALVQYLENCFRSEMTPSVRCPDAVYRVGFQANDRFFNRRYGSSACALNHEKEMVRTIRLSRLSGAFERGIWSDYCYCRLCR